MLTILICKVNIDANYYCLDWLVLESLAFLDGSCSAVDSFTAIECGVLSMRVGNNKHAQGKFTAVGSQSRHQQ